MASLTLDEKTAYERDGYVIPAFRLAPERVADLVAELDRVIAATSLADGFIVVHPGTARDEKYWPAERWAEVIEHLTRERGLQVALTGFANDFPPVDADHELLQLSGWNP